MTKIVMYLLLAVGIYGAYSYFSKKTTSTTEEETVVTTKNRKKVINNNRLAPNKINPSAPALVPGGVIQSPAIHNSGIAPHSGRTADQANDNESNFESENPQAAEEVDNYNSEPTPEPQEQYIPDDVPYDESPNQQPSVDPLVPQTPHVNPETGEYEMPERADNR